MSTLQKIEAYRYRLAVARQDHDEAIEAYHARLAQCRTLQEIQEAFAPVDQAFDVCQAIMAQAKADGIIP